MDKDSEQKLSSPQTHGQLPSSTRANGQAKTSLLCIAAMLSPAILGAILDWSWWVVYLLLIPGLMCFLVSGGMTSNKQIRGSDPQVPDPQVPLADRFPILYALPLFVVVTIFPSRLSGLFIVAGLVMGVLISRFRGRSVPES